MAWEFESPESLRRKGWIPQDEAAEILGLPKGELISWDYIEEEQTGADGQNWVKLQEGVQAFGRSGVQGAVNSEELTVNSEKAPVVKKGKRGPADPALMPQYVRKPCKSTPWGTRAVWITDMEAALRLGLTLENTRRKLRNHLFWGRKRNGQWVACLQLIERFLEARAESKARRARERAAKRNQRVLASASGDGETGRGDGETGGRGDGVFGDRWVSTKAAGEMLQLSSARVCQLVWAGKLRSQQKVKRGPLLVHWGDVCRMADERESRVLARAVPAKEWEADAYRPNYRCAIEAPPGDRLITRKEAAEILGVHPVRVSAMVKRGQLFGWQEDIGKQGSRLWLSERQVNRVGCTEFRLEAKRRWAESDRRLNSGEVERSQVRKWEAQGISEYRWTDEGGTRERNHGEYYNTRQAALLLGVSVQRVAQLRKQRRLSGYQRPLGKNRYERRRWWFYLKEEVHRLRDDPEYRRRQKAYRERQSPEAKDARWMKLLEEPAYIPHGPNPYWERKRRIEVQIALREAGW